MNNSPTYSIKYAGIVDGKIGVLTRHEPMTPYCFRITKSPLKKNRARIMSLEHDRSNKISRKLKAEIDIPCVKPNIEMNDSLDSLILENNKTIIPSAQISIQNYKTTASISAYKKTMITQINDQVVFPDKLQQLAKIINGSPQESPAQSPRTKLNQTIIQTRKILDEISSGFPNPKKYDDPIVHTFAYGKRLYATIRRKERKIKEEFDGGEKIQCKMQRTGFSGQKPTVREKWMVVRKRLIFADNSKRLEKSLNSIITKQNTPKLKRWEVELSKISNKSVERKAKSKCVIRYLSDSRTKVQRGANPIKKLNKTIKSVDWRNINDSLCKYESIIVPMQKTCVLSKYSGKIYTPN